MSNPNEPPDFDKPADQGQQPPQGPPPAFGQQQPPQGPPPAFGQQPPPQGPPPGYGQQPYGQPGPPAYGQPMAGPPLRPDEEKTWALLAHFGALLLGLIAPLIVFVMYKDRSPYVAETSKEALNFNISYAIYLTVAAFSIILLIGLALFPLVLLAYWVFVIIGGVKAANGEIYRFPLIFRFVS